MNPNHDYDTALHEAAHAIAADVYGIPAYPEVTPGGFSKLKQSICADTAGICHLEKPFTPFQDSVISWAGVLGQCTLGTAPGWAPPFKPSAKLLREFYMMTMHQLSRLSDSDRLGILGDYKHSWRACKSAFRIVRKNRPRIIRLAKAIGSKPLPSVPTPPAFPATLAQFNQLVIGGTNPQEKFRAFIHAQTEKFFADSQLRFATPEQRLAGMESWTAARMAKYQAGFPGPDEWIGMARAYRAWSKSAPATPAIP